MLKELRVGIISNSHGLKGEVKILPTTQDLDRFKYLEKAFVEIKGQKIVLKIQGVKYLNKFVVIKFKGYEKIEDILKFKGRDLMISREDAIKLGDNEDFIGDLIGCNVKSQDGLEYGKVIDVIQTGANDVYVVSNGEKEILIPVIKDCILNVDIENEIIIVKLLKGIE